MLLILKKVPLFQLLKKKTELKIRHKNYTLKKDFYIVDSLNV